jgi:hypothetical protein
MGCGTVTLAASWRRPWPNALRPSAKATVFLNYRYYPRHELRTDRTVHFPLIGKLFINRRISNSYCDNYSWADSTIICVYLMAVLLYVSQSKMMAASAVASHYRVTLHKLAAYDHNN